MTFLVETASGELVRKARADLSKTDKVVFDGPDAFTSSEDLQRALEAEIQSAGGLEEWRRLSSVQSQAA